MIIAGALLLGMGIGMAFGDAGAGVIIGLGVGLLLQGIFGKGQIPGFKDPFNKKDSGGS